MPCRQHTNRLTLFSEGVSGFGGSFTGIAAEVREGGGKKDLRGDGEVSVEWHVRLRVEMFFDGNCQVLFHH